MAIEKPTNFINVANTLGYYEYKPDPVTGMNRRYVNLGRLCTHPNINKWAKYKPVRFNSVVELTEAQIELTNYGIEFDELSTIDEIKLSYENNVDSWSYAKPRGGSFNEPFRAGDFNRYAHDAIQPVVGGNVTPQAQNIDGGQNSITGTILINGNPRPEEIGWEDLGLNGRRLALSLYNGNTLIKTAVASTSEDTSVTLDTRLPLPVIQVGSYKAFMFLTNNIGTTNGGLCGIPNHPILGYPVDVVANVVFVSIKAAWNKLDYNQLELTVEGINNTGGSVNLLNCTAKIRSMMNDCSSTIQGGEIQVNIPSTLVIPSSDTPVVLYQESIYVNRDMYMAWKVCWSNGGAYPNSFESAILEEM